MINCLFVGLGGFLGAAARYLLGLLPVEHKSGFPVITLLINIAGALFIGFIVGIAAKNKEINPQLLLFLKTGICGGFTTFSTFALESTALINNGKAATAILYITCSLLFSLGAVIVGQKMAFVF